jgi:hypothetical protein
MVQLTGSTGTKPVPLFLTHGEIPIRLIKQLDVSELLALAPFKAGSAAERMSGFPYTIER